VVIEINEEMWVCKVVSSPQWGIWNLLMSRREKNKRRR